jgi:hypothetical protein
VPAASKKIALSGGVAGMHYVCPARLERSRNNWASQREFQFHD